MEMNSLDKYRVEKLIDQSLNNQVSNFNFNQDKFEAMFTFDFHDFLAKIVEQQCEIKVEYIEYAIKLTHRNEDVTKPIKFCIEKQIRINSLEKILLSKAN